jgi:hypothetical protein
MYFQSDLLYCQSELFTFEMKSDYYNAEKSKALELKIDNLVQVGARDKNYKFANARVDVYLDKLKPNIFSVSSRIFFKRTLAM